MSTVRSQLDGIEKKLDKLIISHELFCEKVNTHEIEINGIPGSETSIGMKSKIKGIGDKLDWFQKFSLGVGSLIFAAIQGIIALVGYLKHRV